MTRILLVGLPGSGASTVGALIAQRLGYPFLDDDALVARAGSAKHAVTVLTAMPGEFVAVLPDEIADDPESLARLATMDAHVVWLRCSLAVLARRLMDRKAGQNGWGAQTPEQLRRLVAERGSLYEDLATQIVDTDALPPGGAAKAVVSEVEQRS